MYQPGAPLSAATRGKMKKLPPSNARKEIFSEKSGQLVQLQGHAALLPGSVVLVQKTLVDSLIHSLDPGKKVGIIKNIR